MSESLGNDWHRVCAAQDIPPEDVVAFDLGERSFAVYNTPAGFFATDGLCTHEEQLLADGFVIDTVIECPLHQGRFDVRTGKALCPPVCVDLKTYPVRVVDYGVYVQITE